jgi:hypothetical protein
VTVEATPPQTATDEWQIMYAFASERDQAPQPAAIVANTADELTFAIPVEQPNAPGIKGTLRVVTRFWNR